LLRGSTQIPLLERIMVHTWSTTTAASRTAHARYNGRNPHSPTEAARCSGNGSEVVFAGLHTGALTVTDAPSLEAVAGLLVLVITVHSCIVCRI